MSNFISRFKNWRREKWPQVVLAAGLLVVAALGFGIGYTSRRTGRTARLS